MVLEGEKRAFSLYYTCLAGGIISVLICVLGVKIIRTQKKKGADLAGGVVEKGESIHQIHIRFCIFTCIYML